MEENLDSQKILGLLVEKYHEPDWMTFPELRAGTGHSIGREIDLYAISPYAKHGYGYSIAFEVKVSRADFKNEIRDPDKRAMFVKNSNQFYFVTPPGLVTPDEIPDGCGLMEAGKVVKEIKIAQQRKIEGYSPIFFVSLLARINKDNPGYNLSKLKMFRYSGQELSTKELEKVFNETVAKSRIEMEAEAFEKYMKEFEQRENDEYKILAETIGKWMGIDVSGGNYHWGRRVIDNSTIIRWLERMRTDSNKVGILVHELEDLKKGADTTSNAIQSFIDRVGKEKCSD